MKKKGESRKYGKVKKKSWKEGKDCISAGAGVRPSFCLGTTLLQGGMHSEMPCGFHENPLPLSGIDST